MNNLQNCVVPTLMQIQNHPEIIDDMLDEFLEHGDKKRLKAKFLVTLLSISASAHYLTNGNQEKANEFEIDHNLNNNELLNQYDKIRDGGYEMVKQFLVNPDQGNLMINGLLAKSMLDIDKMSSKFMYGEFGNSQYEELDDDETDEDVGTVQI